MSKKEIWFRNGEGNEFSCNEGTVAFKLMSEDGTFTEIDGPGGEVVTTVYTLEDSLAQLGDAAQSDPVVVLSKLNRDALIAKAAELGITIDAADKSKTKAIIIAEIEAAQEEAAETDPQED